MAYLLQQLLEETVARTLESHAVSFKNQSLIYRSWIGSRIS
jgi:hypothetical protein